MRNTSVSTWSTAARAVASSTPPRPPGWSRRPASATTRRPNTAAKHGVLGLTKTLAVELAPHDVTVNAVCPTAVDTPMTGGIVESIDEDIAEIAEQSGPDNLLDDIVQPEDISAAFLWLSSDDARFVTGIGLPVAAGATAL
ncbi:SDR family oxidoreductase [Halomicrococcus sp. SG-WS-1]|uniref:SDR family oxidoreductase n=1 Tax=Halomicrococcus sp. SG-WS-1 TaxID=3439057 RepID=UPI003F7AABE0